MAVRYEWKVEEKDGEDIVDTHHWKSFAEAKANAPEDRPFDICLVRDVFDEFDSLTDRSHAYVEDGVLETKFQECGRAVPKKYLAEVNR